jgi:hypothetical protein
MGSKKGKEKEEGRFQIPQMPGANCRNISTLPRQDLTSTE